MKLFKTLLSSRPAPLSYMKLGPDGSTENPLMVGHAFSWSSNLLINATIQDSILHLGGGSIRDQLVETPREWDTCVGRDGIHSTLVASAEQSSSESEWTLYFMSKNLIISSGRTGLRCLRPCKISFSSSFHSLFSICRCSGTWANSIRKALSLQGGVCGCPF